MFLRNTRKYPSKNVGNIKRNIPSHTFSGRKKYLSQLFSEEVIWPYLKTFVEGYPPQIILNAFSGGQVLRIFLHESFGAHIKKYWSYAPGMALATCEMYLLDEFVKPPFETWPPKLCQTHIWQDIAQNIRSNISFNKSDIIFLSKTILILFVRCFGEKHETLRGHISQKSSSGIFWAGWLVGYSSQKCPKHFFGHYPSAILLEISPTNSPCRNFTYTRICSNRSVFFLYTKQNLHQKMFTPKNFFTRRGFTPNSFYIKNLWYERVFTPEIFTTIGTLHQIFFSYIHIRVHQKTLTKNTADYFYSRNLIHQRGFTP